MVSPMAKAQIARDVVMAETLRAHAANGVVLIAGNGHVRTDVGVPVWLRRDALASHATGFLEPGSDATGFDAVRRILPGISGPTVIDVMIGGSKVAVHAVCPTDGIYRTINALKAVGGEGILVTRIDRLMA